MLVGVVWLLIKRVNAGRWGRVEGSAPETVGGVLWLMCGSRMVGDFDWARTGGGYGAGAYGETAIGAGEAMAMMGRRERDEVVRSWGKVYAIGGSVGLDGEERVAVDEAAFISDGAVVREDL